MSLKQKIYDDMTTAMKSKDKETLSVLRMVKGSIQLEEINKKKELEDDDVIAVISKQIKTRKDANSEFEKGNRQDLIDKNNQEISILNRYMPEQLDSSEIEEIITEAMTRLEVTTQKQMGLLMKDIMPKLKGKADMSVVNELIKSKLN
ncbi:MAG: GatB/YqeY domain-containing protein [Firmicutes bacterium]|nr:GatB/YqeY domain-containing protein [Bacillota bacterium]